MEEPTTHPKKLFFEALRTAPARNKKFLLFKLSMLHALDFAFFFIFAFH
jgi:hypothetical protein